MILIDHMDAFVGREGGRIVGGLEHLLSDAKSWKVHPLNPVQGAYGLDELLRPPR